MISSGVRLVNDLVVCETCKKQYSLEKYGECPYCFKEFYCKDAIN